jgi:hypothetical protein
VQGQRGDDPVRGDRRRHRSRGHRHGWQPEPLRVVWREEKRGASLVRRGDGPVGEYRDLQRPGHVLGDGLPRLQVRVRDTQKAGVQKDHRPVRGLEQLFEPLVDLGRHLDLEPAEFRGQRERRRWQELPLGAPASGEGRGGRHHPAQHAQQRAERHDHSQSSPHGDHPHSAATPPWPRRRIILPGQILPRKEMGKNDSAEGKERARRD